MSGKENPVPEYQGAATMEKITSLAKRRGFVFQSS